MVVGCDVIGFMALLFDFGLLIKPVVLASFQASCNGTVHTLWDNCRTQFEDMQFECGLRPLRPFGPVTRVARGLNVARGSNVAFGP